MSRTRSFILVTLGALACTASPALAAPPTYSALALGTLGGPGSLGSGLNTFGQVAGQADMIGGAFEGFVTGPNAAIAPSNALGTLPGLSDSVANAVNDSGESAGYSYTSGSGNGPLAFVSSGGALAALGTFGGAQSIAFGINDSGMVVGGAETAGGQSHAFAHSGSGTLNEAADDLGTLGGQNSTAQAVNNSGTVVGEAQVASGDYQAFSDPGASPLTAGNDLGTLGGANSYAYAVSASGLVAGMSETGLTDISGDAISHAFLDNGSGMIDLGALGGLFVDSVALGVNNAGVVVGNSEEGLNAGPSGELAVADFGSGMVNLNTLVSPGFLGGDTLISASGINNSGEIVADGYDPSNGAFQAFLLAPQVAAVPEAGSGRLLLLVAPLLLFGMGRKKIAPLPPILGEWRKGKPPFLRSYSGSPRIGG